MPVREGEAVKLIRSVVLLSTLVCLLLGSSAAWAQKAACTAMISDHLGNNSTMRVVVLTMNQNATASYMDFVLTRLPISPQSYRLIGNSDQAFSDRRSPPPARKLWDQNQTDKVTLEVLVSPGDLIFRFRFVTWNFDVSIRPTCERSMMYGWGIGSESFFVIKPMSGVYVPAPPSPQP